MIKFEIDSEHRIQQLECAGSPFELATDVGMLMGVIYAQTQTLNPSAAGILRACFETNVRDDAPTWAAPESWKEVGPDCSVTTMIRPRHDDG